jgi:hypothetical protein
MFDRGITNPKFVDALKKWPRWQAIISDKDLFVGIRKECINIYYQGCSLFKISYKEPQLILETHYKYLVHPNVKKPLVSWEGERPAVKDRVDEILIQEFELDLLKKSSRWYAEDEKVGVHSILKSNGNIVDVEVALSPKSDDETEAEDQDPKVRRVADRIDFAAIQKKGGNACIVFFEAKRFHNGELRSQIFKPAVIEQVKRYEAFIEKYRLNLEESYRKVCKNLFELTPDRIHELVKDVTGGRKQLTVDSDVRLVIFDFSADEDNGRDWRDHKKVLCDYFQDRLLMKGKPHKFTRGISN